MEHSNQLTLLQVINRRFGVRFRGKTHSIAQTLGMSDEELAEAERRGFTEEEIHLLRQVVASLDLESQRYESYLKL